MVNFCHIDVGLMVSFTRCSSQKVQNANFGGWSATTKLSTGIHRCQLPEISFVLASAMTKKDTEGAAMHDFPRIELLSVGCDLSFGLSWPTGLRELY